MNASFIKLILSDFPTCQNFVALYGYAWSLMLLLLTYNIRPKKVFKKFLKSFWSSCLLNFCQMKAHRQMDIYKETLSMITVMPLNMHKNLENMHNRGRKLAIIICNKI